MTAKFAMRLVLLMLAFLQLNAAESNRYVGSNVCTSCHQDIGITQAQTKMAHTWQPLTTPQLPAAYNESHVEGPPPDIHYSVSKSGPVPVYHVQMPDQPRLDFPVEAIVGGKRHALTFLFRVQSLAGTRLPRAPLIEGRYIHSVLENGLALELGFPEEKPASYETGFGRVLTPDLEKRCFACHPAPRNWGGQVQKSVACENCHGPGQEHLTAVKEHAVDLKILNPKKLPVAEKMTPCSQCHAGSGFLEDPMPENLLISDQVTSLRNSECWRQSAGQITCVNCHNPHQDASREILVARGERTCLSCHNAALTQRPALCPVNRTTGCVGCHMKYQIRGAFHLEDHWIRVHSENNVAAPSVRDPAWRSTLTPRHMYLRMMALNDAAKANDIHQQLLAGGSFFELARANSIDSETAVTGGYLGDLKTENLDPAWAATVLKLQQGEISNVVEANGKQMIFERMPRNFRFEADAKVDQALHLRQDGKPQESVAALVDALRIYPYFLRALTYLGINFAQSGNAQAGAGLLQVAIRLYPRDQGAHFNLGVAYGALGNNQEIPEYQRTLEIDADYVPAYLNWGGTLFNQGKYDEAANLYRKGIYINPLSAPLHYSLGQALEHLNKNEEAQSEMALAGKIDAKYAGH